ncbi:MAG: MFS transporter [Promethearchaeota archaeon]
MENKDSINNNSLNEKFLPYQPRMKPPQPDSLNVKRTIFFSFAFLTVLLAWSYFNFKVPLILDRILTGNPFKDVLKGFIMALDNLIAVFLQPYFGDLSDRTKSRFGRRMPFIIVGILSSAIFFVLIPWIKVFIGLFLIIFLFDLAMCLYRSPSIAILPDYTPEAVYSKGSAIQQFIANMGGLIGFIIPMIVNLIPNISAEWVDATGFLIVSILMVILLILLVIFVKETPTGDKFFQITDKKFEVDKLTYRIREVDDIQLKEVEEAKGFKSYRQAIKIIKEHRDFAYFLGAIFFMYLAFASVEAFFSSFAMDYLGLYQQALIETGNVADAIKLAESRAGTLFLAYAGPMIASAYFVGMLGQAKKVGRKKAVKIFLSWLVASLLIMTLIVVPIVYHNNIPILIITVLTLISIPWMGFIVNGFSILWALAPEGKVGIYTGIYYTFNQTAYTVAPILFGSILMIFTSFGDFRYIVMFPFVLICVIIAFLFFIKIKGGETKSGRISH